MMTRRQLIARLAAATAALTLAGPALAAHDDAAIDDDRPMDDTLRAFVETVVPGAGIAGDGALKALRDRDLPLARYMGVFAADLNGRARKVGGARFADLDAADRDAVVALGMSRGLLKPLYSGALLMVQVACFAGIYTPEVGSPIIGFLGTFEFTGFAAQTYADPRAFLGAARTTDGNPP